MADRGKDERAIQRHGGRLIRWTGPHGTHLSRKASRLIVSWRHEGVHLSTLMHGNLGNDMSGGTKAVDTEPDARPRHSICTVSNQTGAEKWRAVWIVVRVW